MNPHARTLVAVIVASVLATWIPTHAQAPVEKCGPNDVVPWWPRANFNDGAETLTAAERKVVETRLAAAEALIRKTNYATPRGFAVRPGFSYYQVNTRTELYEYSFAIVTFDKCNKLDEHGMDFGLRINPEPMSWSMGDRPFIDERGEKVYVERPRRQALHGSTATFGGFLEDNSNTAAFFVLFTAGGENPVLPLSREEYLRLKIFEHEGKDQEKLKALIADLSKTPYEIWLAEAPARKKQNEELFALIAANNPAQAAKTRADMEKAEQAEGAKLKAADAFEREKNAKVVATMRAIGDRYRAQLAAMTPAERTSVAYVYNDELVPAGTPDAVTFVRKNPAFYRVRTSVLEPRAILVSLPGAYMHNRPQQAEFYKQLDWAAINKMVNP
jgi:hypothetical protein